MDELQKRMGEILSDPGSMAKLSELAGSLFGGAEEKAQELPGQGEPGRIGRIMESFSGDGQKEALFKALEPFLSPERREKMEKAVKIARLARIARLAIGEVENGDV